MPQIDLRREFAHLYAPDSDAPAIVEVPGMNFIMIDGRGEPARSEEFREAIETLRYLAFALKFNLADLTPELAFAVMPFEALLWREEGPAAEPGTVGGWRWTAMVMQPAVVTLEHFQATAAEVVETKMAKMIEKVRFASFAEGRAAQILHLGAPDDGGLSVKRLHEFLAGEGWAPAGLHHEIYLNDPLRTRPERRRTILRQPVRRR